MDRYKKIPYYVRAKALVAIALLSDTQAGADVLVNDGRGLFISTVDEDDWLCYFETKNAEKIENCMLG